MLAKFLRCAIPAALLCFLTLATTARAEELEADALDSPTTAVQQVSHRTCARCGCRSPKCCCKCPCPTVPSQQTPETPTLPPAEGMAQAPAMSPEFNAFAGNGNYGAARGFDTAGASMLGDFLLGGSFSGNLTLTDISNPLVPLGRVTVPFAVHSFKNSDNESAWARTRLILNTNYFDRVGGDSTSITREMLGFELASANGRASIGVKAPIFIVNPGVQQDAFFTQPVGTFGTETGTSSAFGDLTTTFKYSLIYDPQGGNVLSVGAAVTANSGTDTIGGVTPAFTVDGIQHVASIQPYLSFYKSFSRPGTSGAFLQGFFASESPFNGNDTTFFFTDIAMGYNFRRSPRGLITAVIPTFEVHMDNPMQKKQYTVTPTQDTITRTGYTQIAGTVSYHDQLNLTTGTTLVINRRSTLAFGVVVPVTDTKPYDYELQLNFNRYFGRLTAPYMR